MNPYFLRNFQENKRKLRTVFPVVKIFRKGNDNNTAILQNDGKDSQKKGITTKYLQHSCCFVLVFEDLKPGGLEICEFMSLVNQFRFWGVKLFIFGCICCVKLENVLCV